MAIDNNDINIGDIMKASMTPETVVIDDNTNANDGLDFTPPSDPAPPPSDENKSSLTDDKPAEVKPAAENQPPVPKFEDLLTEKSNGKFKSWDEVENILSQPKEEFANDLVKQINEYVKSGKQFDKDWLRIQSTDYKSIEDPSELIAEKMKLEEPGITDLEIQLEIQSRYKTEEWDEENDTDLTKAMKAKLSREAEAARKWLMEHQDKTAFKPKELTAEQKQLMENQSKEAKNKWSDTVKQSVQSIEKMPLKISDDVTVDFVMTQEDKATLEKIGAELYDNALAPFAEFIDPKNPSNIDVKGMMSLIAKGKMFEKAITLAVEQAQNKGKQEIIKDKKNIDFTPSGSQSDNKTPSVDDQIAQHFAGKLS